MAEPTFAQTTPHDIAEIPAYVIQQRGSQHRYHAPRLSRTALTLRELRDLHRRSWSQRLIDGWRSQGEQTVADEVVTELRYQSTSRTPIYRPVGQAPAPLHNSHPELKHPSRARRLAGKTAVCAALCVSAGALGWTIGSQMQPAQASSPRMVPASVLIAGQNLPTKLPKIEQKAPAEGGLEQGHRAGKIAYTVSAGDTFTTIGRRFGLTPRTVRLVNQLALGAHLRPGQSLVITPADGAIITVQAGDSLEDIAARYALKEATIEAANPGVKAPIAAGTELFLPGVQELKAALASRGYRNQDHNEGSGNQRLVASRSLIGQFGNRVGSLSWPAAGQISSPFGIRGYSFHPGMDICNNVGTPIHAAKGGVVVSSGWMGGYGNAIDVDHGGGIVTRYGHCSKLLVPVGKKVEAGEQIALMGSTGYSTGPHVHFEVRIQGRAVNPAGFL